MEWVLISSGIYLFVCLLALPVFLLSWSRHLEAKDWTWPVIFLWPALPLWLAYVLAKRSLKAKACKEGLRKHDHETCR
jgi:hypothetical protein